MALPATGKLPVSHFRRSNMSLVEFTGRATPAGRNIEEVSMRRGLFSYTGMPISIDFLDHLKPKHARKGDTDEVPVSDTMPSLSKTASSGFGSRDFSAASQSDVDVPPKKVFHHPLGLKTDNALKRTCFEGKSGAFTGDDFQRGVNAKIHLAELRVRERLQQRMQEAREERLQQEKTRQDLLLTQGSFAGLPEEPHPWPGPATPGRSHISGYQGTLAHRTGGPRSPPGSAKTWASSSPSDGRLPPSRHSLSTPNLTQLAIF
eukprot:TRINITY_DN81063_c0_g1_i1.p1 TRINITY_DN81063_c0_g1~~TRINITY_DN81063_c0_g1_i1.p1  ORF type:complete len:270 (+),score=40.51 TRINITY_DN81063_c0_g1_i1:30-812(+)